MSLNIFFIVGARPNFIKAAPLLQAMQQAGHYSVSLVHTGQHYDSDLSDVFFGELGLPKPDFSLGVGSGRHGAQTALMLEKLEALFMEHHPDLVVVFGDVNSTLAGALVASKLHIPVAHIEAGLRSYNKRMPEEVNRVLTDHISDYLFCPSENAVHNLAKEGITENVFNVGDIMYDSLKMMLPIAKKKASHYKKFIGKPYILLTIHRAENTDNLERLEQILHGVMMSDMPVVFPIHPRTKAAFARLDKDFQKMVLDKLTMIDPVGYLDMLMLESNASKILTDSGGVQKEAYFFGVPCITLREETEWVETVDDHWNLLVGFNRDRIHRAICDFIPAGESKNHYGCGDTAEKIFSLINSFSSLE